MIKKHKRVRSGWMRRTSKVYLRGLNSGKADIIKTFLNKYQNAVNYTIFRLWSEQNIISSNLLDKTVTDMISERFDITARLSQCVGKQAKEIVTSQRELSKRKQRIPRFKSHTANLDSRFVTIEEFDGHFDMCIKTASGVPNIVIPFNWTSHTNKFRKDGWLLGNSIRMGYDTSGIFIGLIFEKQKPLLKREGIIAGMGRGYNIMLAVSDGQRIGAGLKPKIKIGGKRRKTWHHYIETETNRCLKELNTDNIKLIAIENLKKVKANKRGKFSRNMNRLLSFWLYARVGNRLEQLCEERGIALSLKNPWKTSQRCSECGNIDRRNRKGEKFLCLSCHHEENADNNASKNLESLGLAGVYSLRSLPIKIMGATP
jgi:putative transposase